MYLCGPFGGELGGGLPLPALEVGLLFVLHHHCLLQQSVVVARLRVVRLACTQRAKPQLRLHVMYCLEHYRLINSRVLKYIEYAP